MTAEIWDVVGRMIRDDGELVAGGTGRYGKTCREMDSAALRDGKHTLAGPLGRADDLYIFLYLNLHVSLSWITVFSFMIIERFLS